MVQSISWAPNEAYVCGASGVLDNADRPGCRVEVPSDFARVEPLVAEKPIRSNPYGLNGVTRAGMVPSLGYWPDASAAVSRRGMTSLPINPPKLHNALDERDLEL